MKPLPLITVAVVCMAVGAAVSSMIRDVKADPTGPFELVAQNDSGNVWVLDSRNGHLRLCLPPLQNNRGPDCWPWSGDAQ